MASAFNKEKRDYYYMQVNRHLHGFYIFHFKTILNLLIISCVINVFLSVVVLWRVTFDPLVNYYVTSEHARIEKLVSHNTLQPSNPVPEYPSFENEEPLFEHEI
jgi:hypothetical protein